MKQLLILKEPVDCINSPSTLFNNIKKIDVDYSQEHFIVFYLDSKNKLINSEIVFKGGLNTCLVDPKIIFRKALIHNSNSIIIAHNHPSEDLKPSKEDIEIYDLLKKVGENLSLKVIDSIIFNKTEYYSLN